MGDYTPNYGSAREMYAYGADSFHGTDSRPENRAEFDRFINKVKAGALREVADNLYGGPPSIPCTQGSVNSSIRVHADRIEGAIK